MIKIYKQGSYIILEDLVSGNEIASGLVNKVFVKPIEDDHYLFYHIVGYNLGKVSINSLVDKDGAPFTKESFKTFYTSIDNSGGGGGETNEILQEIADNTSKLDIEFDYNNLLIPENSDDEYNITPEGSEIRDYQIFLSSDPSQDLTSQSSIVEGEPHKLRIFTTLEITVNIKGTRTKV